MAPAAHAARMASRPLAALVAGSWLALAARSPAQGQFAGPLATARAAYAQASCRPGDIAALRAAADELGAPNADIFDAGNRYGSVKATMSGVPGCAYELFARDMELRQGRVAGYLEDIRAALEGRESTDLATNVKLLRSELSARDERERTLQDIVGKYGDREGLAAAVPAFYEMAWLQEGDLLLYADARIKALLRTQPSEDGAFERDVGELAEVARVAYQLAKVHGLGEEMDGIRETVQARSDAWRRDVSQAKGACAVRLFGDPDDRCSSDDYRFAAQERSLARLEGYWFGDL